MNWSRLFWKERPVSYESFFNGLKKIYQTEVLPLEKTYHYHYFHSPPLEEGDFDTKPTIMLLGQYSTGKTTFIQNLLKTNFPGMRIGPEPTTDKFITVMYGESNRVVPGNALVVDQTRKFKGLEKYGISFLNKLQCSYVKSDVLKYLSIIDTPGILSGEKQRVNRGYDFDGVLKWFAERADRIILLFDAHKLDISDEFKRCIEALQGHDEKIQIILNKADMVDRQQLMRVYGALMWSLGKIINTPEVVRVYVGSFWDEPLKCYAFKELFEAEQQDLYTDLMDLPKNSAFRKMNDLIKRIRSAKVHAYIIATLNDEMPYFYGKDTKKKDLIENLEDIFYKVKTTYNLPEQDMPNCYKMQVQLQTFDFSQLASLSKRMIENVDQLLENDFGKLMGSLSNDILRSEPTVSGGMFDFVQNESGPFGYQKGEGFDAGSGENEWIVNEYRSKYDLLFSTLESKDGKICSRVAKDEMRKSKLPWSVLNHIWKLSDIDNDGSLDSEEFVLAMYLIDIKLSGYNLPQNLPAHLVPPGKRPIELPYGKTIKQDNATQRTN